MASYRRRNTTTYGTYGSVAYAPAYDGSAARAPRREEELRRAPAPYPQRKQQVRKRERAKIQVRQAQLTVANDEMVRLRSELSQLKSDNATLTAQYEKVFDLAALQEAVGDTMVRPTSDQVVYIDLSEPDTVTVYKDMTPSPLRTLLDGAGDIFSSIIEYFR